MTVFDIKFSVPLQERRYFCVLSAAGLNTVITLSAHTHTRVHISVLHTGPNHEAVIFVEIITCWWSLRRLSVARERERVSPSLYTAFHHNSLRGLQKFPQNRSWKRRKPWEGARERRPLFSVSRSAADAKWADLRRPTTLFCSGLAHKWLTQAL